MNENSQASRQVDSHRFLDRLTQKLVRSWIGLEAQRERPVSKYLLRHPWLIPNLFSRQVPAPQQAELESQHVGVPPS